MYRRRCFSTSIFTTLIFTTALAVLHADIYQWEWVDPSDSLQGKQPSPTLCPDGAGLTPAPGLYANNIDLSGGYLIGFDLTGASFGDATLTNADFSEAILTNVNFYDAIITGTNFNSAIGFQRWQFNSTASYDTGELSGVGLAYADLTSCSFAEKNLTGADLTGTDLSGVSFYKATLTDVNFAGATIAGAYFRPTIDSGLTRAQFESTASYATGELRGIRLGDNDLRGWNFVEKDLTDADLAGADLTGAIFTENSFTNTNLTGANLAGANLTDIVFYRAMLTDADLTGATIAGAGFVSSLQPYGSITRAQFESTSSYVTGELSGVKLPISDLSGWDFSGKNLSEASFEYTTLTGADFSGANLTNSNFSDAIITGANFNSAIGFTRKQLEEADVNMVGIDLRGTDLRGCTFGSMNLTNADLMGANLSDSILNQANLTGANLAGATIAGANLSDMNSCGLTREQFVSIGSFTTGELSGINLSNNDLSGLNFAGKNLTYAWFANSDISGANFNSAIGFTCKQLEATRNYMTHSLVGISLGGLDLSGCNLIGKNLADVNFSETDLTDAILIDAMLANTDFSGATIAGAYFSRTTFRGFTQSQFESTASYACGELNGVDLHFNDLAGWDFSGKDLTDASFWSTKIANADFSGATIAGVNLTAADARGAQGMLYETADDLTNFIKPDGRVEGINLPANKFLHVWDYDGLDSDDNGTPDTPLGITVGDGFSIDSESTLIFKFEDDNWGSTIAFDPGIDVGLGGTLVVHQYNGFIPTPGDQWQLFDFTGVTPNGSFDTYSFPDVDGSHWDISRLLTDGVLSLIVTVPLPGDANADGVIDADDAAVLAANWLTASGVTWAQGDFNDDGRVDDADAAILAANWQQTSSPPASVPEPGLIVLLLGGLGCLLLRRQLV